MCSSDLFPSHDSSGGVSASGAQGQGVTQPTDRSVEIKLKQQGLGLQLASIASQVALNKSQAEKNKVEASKIALNLYFS